MSSASWKILPDLVVRHAGFPFEMLDCLKLEGVGHAIDQVFAIETKITNLRDVLLKECFPIAVAQAQGDVVILKTLSRLRSLIGKRKPLSRVARDATTLPDTLVDGKLLQHLSELSQLAVALEKAETVAKDRFDQDRAKVSAALRRTFSDDTWLTEAIWVSNPDLYSLSFRKFTDLQRPVKKSQERRFATYLHRFCAKNDTASFFGPMGYGTLFDKETNDITIRLPDTKHEGRRVFPAFWLIDALAQMAVADPVLQPHLIARPHPMLQLSDGDLSIGTRKFTLPKEAAEIVQTAMTGDMSHSELATTPARAGMLDRLVEKGLITLCCPLPSTILDPMGWLRQFIEQAVVNDLNNRPKVLKILDRLEADLACLQDGSLQSRVIAARRLEQTATEQSLPIRRAAGGTYADRTLTYEECNGGDDIVRFSVAASQALQKRLEPTLNIMGAYGRALADDVRSVCLDAFTSLARGKHKMSYLDFIAGLNRLEETGQLKQETKAQAFSDALHNLVGKRLQGGIAHINAADVAKFAIDDDGCGLYTSPDLMIAAASQEEVTGPNSLIVLGETHQFLATWGSQMMFHPNSGAAHKHASDLIEGIGLGGRLATVLHRRVHKGLVHESFPGVFVEVSGAAGQNSQRMALRDLDVVHAVGKLFLRHRDTDKVFGLYHSGDDKLHLWNFAPPRVSPVPIRLGRYTPRIMVGDVVYQRARWALDEETVDSLHPRHDEFRAMRDLRCIAQANNMPKRFFLRVQSEKKPLFVDLDSPNACTVAHELLRSNGRGAISEMLPDMDGLWFKDAMNHSYCLELRTTCYRPGPATYLPETSDA